MKNKTEQKNKGFTLPELMIVVAVVSVLLLIGVPRMNGLIEGRRLVGQATEVSAALAYARAEATARSRDVIMCASANKTSCSGVNDWSSGWIIYANLDSTPGTISADELFKAEGPMNEGVTLKADSSTITFNYAGVASAAINFNLCAKNASDPNILATNKSRTIKVNAAGNAHISVGDATCS